MRWLVYLFGCFALAGSIIPASAQTNQNHNAQLAVEILTGISNRAGVPCVGVGPCSSPDYVGAREPLTPAYNSVDSLSANGVNFTDNSALSQPPRTLMGPKAGSVSTTYRQEIFWNNLLPSAEVTIIFANRPVQFWTVSEP
jgi:hypothetical protein